MFSFAIPVFCVRFPELVLLVFDLMQTMGASPTVTIAATVERHRGFRCRTTDKSKECCKYPQQFPLSIFIPVFPTANLKGHFNENTHTHKHFYWNQFYCNKGSFYKHNTIRYEFYATVLSEYSILSLSVCLCCHFVWSM